MSEEKKPMHEMIIKRIRMSLEFLKESEKNRNIASIPGLTGIIVTLLQILRDGGIPKKHYQEVIDTLREIQKSGVPKSFFIDLPTELTITINSIEESLKRITWIWRVYLKLLRCFTCRRRSGCS